ncbi:MAG: purine-nucleoside phosphorylase [Rickettsiaceae bacterium]|nr:purine-nucleoside phosphorylase [Rickettsiaceae bacterium]
MENNIEQKINDVVTYIKSQIKEMPQIGLILGSGLGGLANQLEHSLVIPYKDIPHMPNSTAPGHQGNLVIGKLTGKTLITMQGRLHLYEGYSPQLATILVRAMKKLNVETLILTAAAGGLNQKFKAGDIMLITDHINFSGTNPLVGPNLDNFGPRFPGMFDIYTQSLQSLAIKVAHENKIPLQQGIYAGILGPAYATRAELRFLINNNCDAIGMSVIQEATIAAHSQIQILGLAAITDMALPDSNHHSTHEEIMESGKQIGLKLQKLITEVLKKI